MKITITREGKLPAEHVGFTLGGESCLYAEMLENRSFEQADGRDAVGWSPVLGAELRRKTDRPLFAENPYYLRLSAKAGGGVMNRCFCGSAAKKGEKFLLTFYLRSFDYKGKAAILLCDDETVFCEKKFKVKADGKWRRYSYKLKACSDAEKAVFLFRLLGEGTVHLDCFSLVPENAIKGIFRRSLAEKMKEAKPALVRFPVSLCGEKSWKETLLPAERRMGCEGIYEDFLLTEYLGAAAFPVIEEQDSENFFRDALEFLSFACDPEETEWGSARAELGHSEPFRVSYFGIGKEHAALIGKLHERFPAIKMICMDAPGGEDGFFAHGEKMIASPEQLYELKDVFAAYPRSGRVLLSECTALTDGGGLARACAEAAFLTGAEQNADVAFAMLRPLPAEGKKETEFFVTELFSLYTGISVLPTKCERSELCASASERDKMTYLKLVNPLNEEIEAEIEGDYDFGVLRRILRIEDEGTDAAPYEAAPSAPRRAAIPPHSIQVLVFCK